MQMSISDSVSESSEENFDTSATVQQLFSEAVTKDNYEMAKWALLNGADVNKFANYEYISEEENPLMVSISNSNEKMAMLLLKNGADVDYVDENGMITSTPPTEDIKKEEINPDEIIIATPKKEEEEPAILRGRVEFFNEARGFGFIKDLNGVEKYFFHVNNVVGNIVENNIVTFDLERGTKGMNAVNICLEKQ